MTGSLSIKVEGNRAGEAKALRERSVGALLVGLPEAFAETLALQIHDAGQTSACVEDALSLDQNMRPSIVVANLDLPLGLELISAARELYDFAEIVAITNAPCVVRIAQAVRRGAAIVMARPTTFGQIQAGIAHPNLRPPTPDRMSLDRAIWEFLNQAVLEAGSISGAARLLRIDRTSLKRMLRKVPGG